MCSLLYIVFGASTRMMQLEGWFKSCVPDSVLVLVVVVGRLRHGTPLLLTLRKFFLALLTLMFIILLLMLLSLLILFIKGFLILF